MKRKNRINFTGFILGMVTYCILIFIADMSNLDKSWNLILLGIPACLLGMDFISIYQKR